MKKLILLLFPLSTFAQFTPSELDGIVRAINERNALIEAVDTLNARLTTCDIIIRNQNERITELVELSNDCENTITQQVRQNVVMRKENDQLREKNEKLKRNRWLFGSGGVVVGALATFFIVSK